MKKQILTALCRLRNRILLVTVPVVVIGGTAGDDGSLKGCQSLAYVYERVRLAFSRKRFRKQSLIRRVGSNHAEKAIVFLEDAQLDRVVIEDGGERLVFQLRDCGIRPVKERKPGHVCSPHYAAWVGLPGDPDRDRLRVSKAVLLLMAGRTRAFTVRRHPQ